LTYAHGQRFMVPHPSRQWCFTQELGTHWYEAPVAEYAPLYGFVRANMALLDGFEAAPDVRPQAPKTIAATVRRKGAAVVVHLVGDTTEARCAAPGTETRTVPVRRDGDTATVTVPAVHLWTVVGF
jgi:hypothetical protein